MKPGDVVEIDWTDKHVYLDGNEDDDPAAPIRGTYLVIPAPKRGERYPEIGIAWLHLDSIKITRRRTFAKGPFCLGGLPGDGSFYASGWTFAIPATDLQILEHELAGEA